MITNNKKWHYLFVKILFALLKGITSKHDGGFYCLNCFYSFTTENALENIKTFAKITAVAMWKDNNILKYNSGAKIHESSYYYVC